MNEKLREIISDLSLWYLASEEELQPFDINAGPCYIIEKSYVEYMIDFMKQQSKEIEQLAAENKQLKKLLSTFADDEFDPFGVVQQALKGKFPFGLEDDEE
ncbi:MULTISPECIES: hypothetical protein [Bacillus]|uniref:hypothetical protein n=1 Tax=Bacillus TaxID=1386 RepID=UPI001581C2E7|nr:hypothetical protein [Bacillus glycinifermentans]MBU8789026.1 hypothetical protein [Bacillus glycinifermentans]NUJ18032.1 hypothetical protein [Bacillus glycinifermentans]WKB77944.1 hypothetical protein QYM22_03395 [Bacillus glycinifermentans]